MSIVPFTTRDLFAKSLDGRSGAEVVPVFIARSLGFFGGICRHLYRKYYNKIVDLENKADVGLERNPPFIANFKIRALKTPDLTNISVVLSLLMHANTNQQQEPYKHYFRALSLLAKNDIFVEFGLNVLVEFYESLAGRTGRVRKMGRSARDIRGRRAKGIRRVEVPVRFRE
jgi:hypothetical protein